MTDVNLIQKKSASCCQEARSDVPASFFFQIFSLKYYNYRKARECFGIEQVLQKFISTSFSVVYFVLQLKSLLGLRTFYCVCSQCCK